MRIVLNNDQKTREHYLNLARASMARVERAREEWNKKYEARWRKRVWPFKDRPKSVMPPVTFDYPSRVSGLQLSKMQDLIAALQNPHVHEIILDENDLYYLE